MSPKAEKKLLMNIVKQGVKSMTNSIGQAIVKSHDEDKDRSG
jgi:hypothetical protein